MDREISKELQAKALEVVTNEKVMGLANFSAKLGVTPLEAALALPNDYQVIVSGEKFTEVWEQLASIGKMTLIVVHDGCVFEVPTTVPAGVFGRGYYNILSGDQPLHGHIAADKIAYIGFLSIPFMQMESHSVTFFNNEGQVMFSLHVGRVNHKLIPEGVAQFKVLKEKYLHA